MSSAKVERASLCQGSDCTGAVTDKSVVNNRRVSRPLAVSGSVLYSCSGARGENSVVGVDNL